MKKKLSSIAGLTLVEILIAVVISALMMAAMFTSYSIVNSTYRQVTDRAKISQAGRDLVGQILREVRMAGLQIY
jgi:Tfp pilus assembly protein PilW